MIASIRSKATWAQNIKLEVIQCSETMQTIKKNYTLLQGINTIKTEKRNEHINKPILPLLWHWTIFTTNVDREMFMAYSQKSIKIMFTSLSVHILKSTEEAKLPSAIQKA